MQGEEAYRTHLAQTLAGIAPAGNSWFDGLSQSGIDRCAERSIIIDCVAGDHVIKRDGTARNAYLVLAGDLEARDGDRVIRALSPGDVFGETGLLLRLPRTADVFVTSDMARILSLSEKSLRSVIGGAGDDSRVLVSHLLTLLASRLRDANALTG